MTMQITENRMPEKTVKRTFVCGHRNPDVDTLASSYALAELRRRQGLPGIEAICPGILPEKARYLFNRFHLEPPVSKSDVYLRVADVMDTQIPTLTTGTPLMEAVRLLNASGYARLPVIGPDRKWVGMLSPLNLLSQLLDAGRDAGSGLAGRQVRSSIALICKVIEAEALTSFGADSVQDFQVYVAAMGIESFSTHIPKDEPEKLALISGDRPEIHLLALQSNLRLLIVTGEKSVEPLILNEARQRQVTILKTPLDSATVIRRLKFSVPVETFGIGSDPMTLHLHDRIHGLERQIMAHPEDVIPVVGENGRYEGVVCKRDVSAPPPYQMILVDHNEAEQSIPGIEEIPVIEVVDHHRLGMMRTAMPIRFTGDVVGSTCTLVAGMFKSSGESLTPELAGLLLGGIVADTLNLKSPTTAPQDRRMLEWLEKISGVSAAELWQELSQISSPMAVVSARQVIDSDRKSYSDGKFHFSLSQVEETKFELFHHRSGELCKAMQQIMGTEQLQFIGLLVTDAVRENSELLLCGDEAVLSRLPYQSLGNGIFALPGVLSRKKQLLPQILAITAELNR